MSYGDSCSRTASGSPCASASTGWRSSSTGGRLLVFGALLLLGVGVARSKGPRDVRRPRPGRAACSSSASRDRADGCELAQRGIPRHEPAGDEGRRPPQQALGRQLAREDQRRGARPEPLRAHVRLRRSRHRHGDRGDGRQVPDAARVIAFKKEILNQKHDLEFEQMRPPVCPPLRAARRHRPAPPPWGSQAATATVPAGGAAPAAALPSPCARPAGPRTMTPAEVTQTLAGLADLRDRGAITPEEYEAKKADLLGRL